MLVAKEITKATITGFDAFLKVRTLFRNDSLPAREDYKKLKR